MLRYLKRSQNSEPAQGDTNRQILMKTAKTVKTNSSDT